MENINNVINCNMRKNMIGPHITINVRYYVGIKIHGANNYMNTVRNTIRNLKSEING